MHYINVKWNGTELNHSGMFLTPKKRVQDVVLRYYELS